MGKPVFISGNGVLISQFDAQRIAGALLAAHEKLTRNNVGFVNVRALHTAMDLLSIAGTREHIAVECNEDIGSGRMTTAHAAERLGITPRAVRGHVERGNLTAHKIGGKFYFDPLEIEGFAAERTKEK